MESNSATTDPDVRIRTATDRQQLPGWLSARLHLGAHRVEQLRRDIAAQAGLPTLPPVEIFPEVWTVGGDLVLGRVGAIEREGELHLGVLLPAPSVVQSDDHLVRCILLVQFHDYISRMVPAATQDTTVRTLTSFVDPAVWFGPDDVARLRNWKEHKIAGMETLADLISKSLPILAPPPEDVTRDFNIPDWVLARLDDSVAHSSVALGERQ